MATPKIHILSIDDCEIDISAIRQQLDDTMTDAFEIFHLKELSGSLDILRNKKVRVDVILLDLGLIDARTPKEIFKTVEAAINSIPIIVITGKEEHELALFVINGGAADNLHRGDFAEPYSKLKDAITFSLARCALLKEARTNRDNAIEIKNQLMSYVSGAYSGNKTSKPD